ncbi:MAG: 1,4-alpha-glucan branching protein domain-containing protein, partial [Thermodesulfobacteriota bacterium]
ERTEIGTITPTEYLEKYPVNQQATPPQSSWGFKGYSEFWLNGSNDWIYPHLHKANERMIDLANRFQNSSNQKIIRALNQAARELMLAQSSDWAFIMKTNTMADYAVKRTKDHIGRFSELYEMLQNNIIDEKKLMIMEYRDNIFPDVNFRDYSDK